MMSDVQITSAYVIHTQVLGVGDKPFPNPDMLRIAWHPLFTSPDCFRNMANSSIRSRSRLYSTTPNPSEWGGGTQRGQVLSSALFVRHLGCLELKPHQMAFASSPYARDLTATLLEGRIPTQREGETHNYPERRTASWGKTLGVNVNLPDQRMNCLCLEVAPELFLESQSELYAPAQGRMSIHFYPAGYIVLRIAIGVPNYARDPGERIERALQHSWPGRRRSNWRWSSRRGHGTLADIADMVKDDIARSIYKDSSAVLHEFPWRSAYKIVSNSDMNRIANGLGWPNGPCSVVSRLDESERLRGILTSRQGVICLVRPLGAKPGRIPFFARLSLLNEFVSLKNSIYEDYGSFLRGQVRELKQFRLSFSQKTGRENLLRFSVYDEKIPQFLNALDDHVLTVGPFHRRVYATLSEGSGFAERHSRLKILLSEWEEEVEKWDPPLVALWKRIMMPVRSALK